MCRSIRPLYNFDPPATEEEIEAASLQFVKKISGFSHPSRINEKVINATIKRISQDLRHLLQLLSTNAPPRNREQERIKAHIRSQQRFGVK